MKVAQSALPLCPVTLIAYAWHPPWLYEQLFTVHSLTCGISMVVMCCVLRKGSGVLLMRLPPYTGCNGAEHLIMALCPLFGRRIRRRR
jgi:hypothetical protein